MSLKVCAITAATSGLGIALSKKFAENGYSLLLHSRNQKDLEDLLTNLKKVSQADFQTYLGDLRKEEELSEFGNLLSKSKCEVLINNAGVACPGLPLSELSDVNVKDLLAVNLYAPIMLSKSMMKNKSGSIININSLMAIEPKPNRSVYCGVRAGLMGFTEAMYNEAQEKGFRFIGVYPSRIRSRPEYEFGMETKDVADKVFDFYKNEKGSKLILDGRPPEFKRG